MTELQDAKVELARALEALETGRSLEAKGLQNGNGGKALSPRWEGPSKPLASRLRPSKPMLFDGQSVMLSTDFSIKMSSAEGLPGTLGYTVKCDPAQCNVYFGSTEGSRATATGHIGGMESGHQVEFNKWKEKAPLYVQYRLDRVLMNITVDGTCSAANPVIITSSCPHSSVIPDVLKLRRHCCKEWALNKSRKALRYGYSPGALDEVYFSTDGHIDFMHAKFIKVVQEVESRRTGFHIHHVKLQFMCTLRDSRWLAVG